jgi:hypothetical protein
VDAKPYRNDSYGCGGVSGDFSSSDEQFLQWWKIIHGRKGDKVKLLGCILALSLSAFGANHFVCATATCASHGTGSGADWNNTFTSFPASPVRGDTYYFAKGSYGTLTVPQITGSSTITLLAATIADHGTPTGWLDTMQGIVHWTEWDFNGTNASNYTFSGATGGGLPDWACANCLMEIDVGTGTIACGICVSAGTISNINLLHLNIAGPGIAACGINDSCDLIYFCASACSGTYANWLIQNSYLHDSTRTMILTYPNPGTGMTIDHNFFARNGVAEHREAWSLSTDSNVVISNNIFEDIWGTGIIAAVNGAGTASNWLIEGNIMEWTGTVTNSQGTGVVDTGVITMAHSNCPTSQCIVISNYLIFNNVIANLPNSGAVNTSGFDLESITGSPGAVCENNIWYNNKATGGSGCTGGNSSPNITTADYNWYFGNTTNGNSGAHDTVGSATPFNSGTNANFPTGNWTLKASIPGLAQTGYTVDMLGNAFAPNWDRGALAFTSGVQAAPPPALGMFAEAH